jgi:peptidoglycan/LPS O-acetylase OafA/YrhL
VAYHLGALPGGFVGVDLFFVLSGFLITGLLLADPPTSRGQMLRWWGQRVRRLTPAVAVVVAVVLLVFATRSDIALDALATLTWWQNWNLIAQGTDYWGSAPSPLRHAWSLSIEEQFYLVWPLVTVGLVFAARRRSLAHRLVGAVALGGSVASFVWAAHLATGAQPDLSRIYFGTDTRAGALLLGCAAAAWVAIRSDATPTRVTRFLRSPALAVGAVAVLVAATLVGSPERASTYTVLLPVVALASLATVFASADRGPLERPLSWAPLQWLGKRSYAIYLWSWPIQVLCEELRPDASPLLVAAVTVGASLPLASLSLRLIETPLRRQTSWASARTVRRAAWGVGLIALLAAGAFAANSTVLSEREQLAEAFEPLPDPVAPPPVDEVGAPSTTCVPGARAVAPQFAGDGSAYDPSTVTAGTDPVGGADCGAVRRVLVVGDSTGRGAANGLKRLARDDLAVWDRTQLGCGLVSDDPECGDWRSEWTAAVAEVDPDVVLVHLGVSSDLVPGADPPFQDPAGTDARRATVLEVARVLTARGARIVWMLPPVPMESASFFCGGRLLESPCDPEWVGAWHRDVGAAAAEAGITTVDLDTWIRGRTSTATDRPDGLHLSGPALDEQARWIAAQLP